MQQCKTFLPQETSIFYCPRKPHHQRKLPLNQTLYLRGSTALCVRGSGSGIRSTAKNPRKRKVEATIDTREPQRTRGIWCDYRYLADPFPDKKEAGMLLVAKEKAFAVIPEDNCHSLKEVQESSDWPEWERAIHTELEQLCCMGTWKLVDKPASTVPRANKWVFTKKQNKQGILTKYKVRLVTRGCAQHPGHDYIKTHSPVMCLETIRAILVIAPTQKLII